jgi:hypothetical protein
VTVELLDALRRGGLLTATVDGWRWDDAAVRARLGDSEEASFVQARVSALPAAARQVVEAMACLGGRAEAGLLQTAIGQPAAVVEQAVAPALEDGLLVTAVRFRHDRLREAILRGLDPSRRRPLQLGMARRLAGVPELFALAAEQYLPVVDAVTDSQERQEVVGLLRCAADQAAVIGDQARMSTLLAAALGLVDPGDTITLIELRTGNHAALFGLGRLDEACRRSPRTDRCQAAFRAPMSEDRPRPR